MSKKVYTLKRSTHREQYRHMKNVLIAKAELAEQQDREALRKRRAEVIEIAQQVRYLMSQAEYNAWWESAPEDGFLDAARAKLAEVRGREQETTAEECVRINQWLSDNWDFIPEIPFGEGV